MSESIIHEYGATELRQRLLVSALLAILAMSVWLVGGAGAVTVVFAGLCVLHFSSPRIDVSLLMHLHRGRQVPAAAPLCRVLRALAVRANLPFTPLLYIAPASAPNAFAVGNPHHSAIALSAGILPLLNQRELAGVLAHEIAHIANGDTRRALFVEMICRMTTATAVVGLAFWLAYWIQVPGFATSVWLPAILLVCPVVAFVLQRASSRNLEHHADARAALLTGDPHGLATALTKIDRATRTVWDRITRSRDIPMLPAFLQTHPQMEERVQRLQRVAKCVLHVACGNPCRTARRTLHPYTDNAI